MTGVKYENQYGLNGSMPKGKVPVFMMDGALYDDSQLGWLRLAGMGVVPDVDKDLEPRQRAVAVAFRGMIDSVLVPILILGRWRDTWPLLRDNLALKAVPMPIRWVVGKMLQPGIVNLAANFSKFSDDELYGRILLENFAAIDTQLGLDYEWLVGSPGPTTADGMLFGLLATMIYHPEFTPKMSKAVLLVLPQPHRTTVSLI